MAVDTRERAINIKKLVVEEPVETPRPFDAEVEITPEDWQVIDGFINKYNTTTTAWILTHIKTLSPEHFNKYILKEPEWEQIKDYEARNYVPLFADAREKMGIGEEFYEKLVRDAKGQQNFYGIEDIALLAPDRLNELATDEYKNKYVIALKASVNNSDYGPYARTRIGASFRLLFPGSNLAITNSIWDGMRKRLKYEMKHALDQKEMYGDDWTPGNFVALAKQMKVLAADEVKVDKDGIHLIFNPKMPTVNEAPQIPESKKF